MIGKNLEGLVLCTKKRDHPELLSVACLLLLRNQHGAYMTPQLRHLPLPRDDCRFS